LFQLVEELFQLVEVVRKVEVVCMVVYKGYIVAEVLLTASLNINPDDAQQVEITFRPSGAPTFDFSTTV
jgi:hypothetical protein